MRCLAEPARATPPCSGETLQYHCAHDCRRGRRHLDHHALACRVLGGCPGIRGFAVREVAAPADAVFAWILRPDLQEPYYGALRRVRSSVGAADLTVGATASFMLGPLLVPKVKVVQADPELRSMAWVGGGPGLSACHAFTVKPLDAGRSLLRSDEIWTGPAARLLGPVARGGLQKVQTDWAEALVRAATAHPAGPLG